ncbi:MAG: hypothetical protein OEW68_05635 [Gammaproteobacteria bacterium]|nr:hypothetical protein [Gammaproteobacteria bacterium]MDH4314307.1 hypothetical protein [Gammaproteobacteria bacterium]MDH5215289.1 hypothetical protein [Gammaproteobacteria bacterium]
MLRFALSGLLAIGLAPFLAVSAQTLDDYAQRQVFDFEQCANACQIELDQQVFSCGPFREDKSRAMPEDCFESNYDQYERCMNACPADPRKQP